MKKTCQHSFVILNCLTFFKERREDGSYPQTLTTVCAICKEKRRVSEALDGKVTIEVL